MRLYRAKFYGGLMDAVVEAKTFEAAVEVFSRFVTKHREAHEDHSWLPACHILSVSEEPGVKLIVEEAQP